MFRFWLSTNKNQFKISDDVEKYIKQSHADFLRKLETRVLSYERNRGNPRTALLPLAPSPPFGEV
jgi:hypothetical protein